MNIRKGAALRTIPILLILLFGCLPVFSSGQPDSEGLQQEDSATDSGSGAYPLAMADDTGFTVRLARRPQRIISLTAFTDDILLDLVDHRRLIGVTNFSEDPTVSNIADKIDEIPHRLTVNVEVILSLQPDLLFVANWHEADKVAQLREAGIPVYLIATGLNVAAIQEKIRTIGILIDERQRADAMIAEMNRRIAELSERVSTVEEPLSVMDYATWGSAQGAGSSWDEVIRLAGLTNAVAVFPADEWGQVPLSKEKILELDPDLLILPGWVFGDPDGADAFYERTVGDPALQGLSAVRGKRVYQMPEGLKAATSQYIVDAAEYLARLAYPQLF